MPFGVPGGARGVEDEQRVLRVERLGLVRVGLAVDGLVPPDVAALGPRHLGLGALDHEDVLDGRRLRDGLVRVLLHGRGLAAAELPVRGDQQLGLGVEHAGLERARGEAAEDDAVRRTQTRAGQHRDDGLGDHRQLDRDPVACAYAQLGQRVRRLAHLALQLGVGDRPRVAGLALPVERDLLAVTVLDVAVHAVVGDVELAADEPLGERRLPVEHLVPALRPREPVGLLGPERLAVGVGAVVPVGRRVGLIGEPLRRREAAALGGQVVQRGTRHLLLPSSSWAGQHRPASPCED